MVWEDGPDWVLKASPVGAGGGGVAAAGRGRSGPTAQETVSGGKGAPDYAGDVGHARPPTRLGNAGATWMWPELPVGMVGVEGKSW